MRKFLLIGSSLLALSACDLAPDYTLPEASKAPGFKEEKPAVDATQAPAVAPADDIKWKRVDEKAKIEEFAWWRMFNMPALDQLEEQGMKDNPSLEVAAQRVATARATAEIDSASLFPTVDLGFGPKRQKPDAADIKGSFPTAGDIRTKPYTTYTAQGSINYELDLFGKNRNTAKAAELDAAAEDNNYRASRLTLQADIAQAYFQYAALQMEADILKRTIADYKDTRALTVKKRDIGEVDDLVLSTADTELANAQADYGAVQQQIAMSEHTIAILVGVSPTEFSMGATKLSGPPPVIPAGVPATLLERRPDIQAAANSVGAANATVGVARAGYFPDISLSAVGGYTSGQLHNLFKKPNQFWSLGGPAGGLLVSQPIFEGGLLSGNLAASKAEYEGAVASYRASVLQAFREVEDNLSSLNTLSTQAAARAYGVKASKRSYDVATARFNVGYSSNLDKLDAERSFLAEQRSEIQVLGQRYVATAQLVKALGGSWQTPPAAVAAVAPAGAPAPEAKTAAPAVTPAVATPAETK